MSTPVLIDTDPGNDDAVLLALAAAAEQLDIVGVTTVSGNVQLKHTTRNARAILDWFDKSDVPVAPGAAAPLVKELDTASGVHGPDGLHKRPPEPTTDAESITGVNMIVEQARAYPGELTLVAVGPLTNVALALAIEPSLPELLDDFYVMGGAAFVAGNATPRAEFNFYADPEAAYRVIREANPKVVGLDVTNPATVSPETIREWANGEEPFRTIASWLAYAAPEAIEERLADSGPMSIHDAAVGVDIIADVIDYESYPAEVETNGSCRGALICDSRTHVEREPNARIGVDIDVDTFQRTLLRTLESLTVNA